MLKLMKTAAIFTVLLLCLIMVAPPASANFGWQKGREDIGFSLRLANGQRPSWANGFGEGSLTCERRFGFRGQKVPQSYLAEVIKFDQSTVNNQEPIRGVAARFIWGDALSPRGSKGTVRQLQRKHVLDLKSKNVYGVALTNVTVYTKQGASTLKQEGENSADFLGRIENDDIGNPINGGVRAKCPDLPRKELSVCEITGSC